jgi:hypothetical protein
MIVERLRKNWFLLLAGMLLLAGGLWLNIRWLAQKPSPVLYLINFGPGLILILVWFLASQFPGQRGWFIVPGALLTLAALVFVYFANGVVGYIVASTTPIFDVNQYETIVQSYDPKLTQHFPPQIPGNATEVKFYYEPAFLQGGSYLQLRCKLPAGEIAALLDRYLPIAKEVRSGNETGFNAAIPLTSFYGETQLPEDFRILILGGEPYKTNPVDWNHGYTYGLAISTQRQEVIYYADYW